MNKTLLLAAVGASFLAVNSAQAVNVAPYVGVKTGMSMFENDPSGFPKQDENLWFGSIAAGVDFQAYNPDAPYSFEIEYTYRPQMKKNHTGGADVKGQSRSLMLNGYYEFLTENQVRPFASAGIGWSKNNRKVRYYDGFGDSKSAYDLTWSLGAGVKIVDVAPNTDGIFGYRYVDMGEMKTGLSKAEISSQEIYAGINYKF